MKQFESFINAIPKLISVIPSTLLLFLGIIGVGIVLGMLLAWVRLKGNTVGNVLVSIYISFIRGTPLLIQILIVYFGLRAIAVNGFGNQNATRWPAALFVFIAYSLNLGAFLCETFRSAYTSVDFGQVEAGMSINMKNSQIFWHIIFPQAARIALPNMSNLLIDDYKALSLAFSIGFIDIMGRGEGLAGLTKGVGAVGIYLAVAALYWLVCKGLDIVFRRVEWGLSKDIRVAQAAVAHQTS